MNFEPLGERVLVERVEEPTTTKTGIIIPDNAKEKPLNGKVVAVSKKVKKKDLIAVDDTVVFAKYSGTEVSINGTDYLVMNTDDLLGILK